MIVRPHLEYASTCWKPYTKRNIDKLEAVQRRAVWFVLSFYDYHPTADLSCKIQKSLQWDSLQHRTAATDLCMFHKLRNNLANIAIPPILVPFVKHNCHYNHIQSLHSYAFWYQFFARGVRFWNIIPCHLTTKPSLESFCTATFQWISPLQWYKHPGTNTWCLVQISAQLRNINNFLCPCLFQECHFITLSSIMNIIWISKIIKDTKWHLSIIYFVHTFSLLLLSHVTLIPSF